MNLHTPSLLFKLASNFLLPLLLVPSLGTAAQIINDSLTVTGGLVVGTDTPDGDFEMRSNGIFIGKGVQTGISSLLASDQGAGSRLLWYPQKSAFRAGAAYYNLWDDANIGIGSVAFGYANSASGAYSFAAGYSNFSTGNYAFATGNGNTATGMGSTALGMSNTAGGENAVAIGNGNETGDGAFCFGIANSANASGYALGEGCVSSSLNVAAGFYSVSTGCYSLALGTNTYASGDCSTALGQQTSSGAAYSLAVGCLNVGGGDPYGWVPTDPLFEIGNGDPQTATPVRSNAVTTLKNGQTTLTNNAWRADPNVAPTTSNSNGEALVVEGHADMKGNLNVNGALTVTGQPVKTWLSTAGFVKQTDDGYQTPVTVDTAITSKGYQTATQVDTAITSKGYLVTTDLSAELGTRNVVTVSTVGAALAPANTPQVELGKTTISGDATLNGKVIITVLQGDISMGIYGQ